VSPAAGATTAELEWLLVNVGLGSSAVPIARLKIEVYLPTPTVSTPVSEKAWLDTGAPLSVIRHDVHKRGLVWRPMAGVRTTWSGQLCDVGHIDIWLTDLPSGSLRGPFPMLAKFPHSDPPGDPVPVLLGLEFLITNQAALTLPPAPQPGTFGLP
jgi:hypothetical protein